VNIQKMFAILAFVVALVLTLPVERADESNQ
jgi:hypothetical protein